MKESAKKRLPLLVSDRSNVDPAHNTSDMNDSVSGNKELKRRQRRILDWFGSGFGSILLHLIVILILFWVISSGKDGLPVGERRTDEVGIVLSSTKNPVDPEISDVDIEQTDNSVEHGAEKDPVTDSEALKDLSERLLPSNEIGLSADSDYTSVLSDVALSNLNGNNGDAIGQSVGFCGVKGSGKKFVYVLDRSDSMSWKGGAPMRRCVNDAVASIGSLDPKQGATKFQLVVYNHDVEVFEGGSELIDVNEANKVRMKRYLQSIVATGGTNPEKALELGMRMRPDVVFFLTDADEELSVQVMESVKSLRKKYKVKQICVVEFGKASMPKKRTFRQLAGENNGTYVFKNIEAF